MRGLLYKYIRIIIINASYKYMGCFNMFVIRKERIILLALFVFISIFTYSITTNKKVNTIETVALPISNKVIVVDAGHGNPDERGTK